jgi:uronate dehydrogenase
VSLAGARALGYEPRDEAEVFAAEVFASSGVPDPDAPDAPADPVFRYLGGEFTFPSFDADRLS